MSRITRSNRQIQPNVIQAKPHLFHLICIDAIPFVKLTIWRRDVWVLNRRCWILLLLFLSGRDRWNEILSRAKRNILTSTRIFFAFGYYRSEYNTTLEANIDFKGDSKCKLYCARKDDFILHKHIFENIILLRSMIYKLKTKYCYYFD